MIILIRFIQNRRPTLRELFIITQGYFIFLPIVVFEDILLAFAGNKHSLHTIPVYIMEHSQKGVWVPTNTLASNITCIFNFFNWSTQRFDNPGAYFNNSFYTYVNATFTFLLRWNHMATLRPFSRSNNEKSIIIKILKLCIQAFLTDDNFNINRKPQVSLSEHTKPL